MAYVLAHAITVLAAIASFVMVISLLRSRRTPQSALAWLLGLVFLPFLALPLFFLLGDRKFPARAKRPDRRPEPGAGPAPRDVPPLARVLRATGVADARPGNHFELLTTGEAAFTRLLELIRDATRSIDLTLFILGWDDTGRSVVAALSERARSGVRVRVILDAVGSLGSRDHAEQQLSAAGAELRTFMPFWHAPWRGRSNLRCHRKLAVFDGETVFGGGMNLADEYLGRPRPEPRWRDVAAVCRGPVAGDAAALFDSDWRFCGGRSAAAGVTGADGEPPPGAELVQLVPSGPDFDTDTVYDLFLSAIYSAQRRVSLVTPYYVPDDALQRALLISARRGTETRVLVPSVSNHALADVARRPLLRELAAAGAIVKYYDRGMVHAKAMVVDDSFGYVGSPNFDMRSLFLNYEVALCCYSPGAVAQIGAYIDALAAECVDVGPDVRRHPIVEQLAQFLTPEL